MKKSEAVDANGNPIVPMKRKYNKSGALRKPYQSRKLKLAAAAAAAAAGETQSSATSDHGGIGNRSGGEDTNADQTMDQSTANSSLNSTLAGGPSGSAPIVTKRKYQKRKKPPQDGTTQDAAAAAAALGLDPSVASTPAGSTGLAKVEGTKLIIQKKAIKLASGKRSFLHLLLYV